LAYKRSMKFFSSSGRLSYARSGVT
jgi:hypothetical protein